MVERSTPADHRAIARWCVRLLALVGGALFIWAIGATSASALDVGSTVTKVTDTVTGQTSPPTSNPSAPPVATKVIKVRPVATVKSKATKTINAVSGGAQDSVAKARTVAGASKATTAVAKTTAAVTSTTSTTLAKTSSTATAVPVVSALQSAIPPVAQVLSTNVNELVATVDHAASELIGIDPIASVLPVDLVSATAPSQPGQLISIPMTGTPLPSIINPSGLTPSLTTVAANTQSMTPSDPLSGATNLLRSGAPASQASQDFNALGQLFSVLGGIGGAVGSTAPGSDSGGSLLAITSALILVLGIRSVRTPWLGGHVPVQPHLIQVTPD